jgi:hypothetical protein
MPSGALEQHLAKLLTQAVGLGGQHSIHKLRALRLPGSIQIHTNLPKVALELGQHLLHRVPFPGAI